MRLASGVSRKLCSGHSVNQRFLCICAVCTAILYVRCGAPRPRYVTMTIRLFIVDMWPETLAYCLNSHCRSTTAATLIRSPGCALSLILMAWTSGLPADPVIVIAKVASVESPIMRHHHHPSSAYVVWRLLIYWHFKVEQTALQ